MYSRNDIPRLFKVLLKKGAFKYGAINFDIGGGSYDKGSKFLQRNGVCNVVIDKYALSEDHNDLAINFVYDNMSIVNTATIVNVLNVVPNKKERYNIYNYALLAKCAYFCVYEGARNCIPEINNFGYQANRPIQAYIPEIVKFFTNVELFKISGVKFIKAYR